jgi:hypothetical protein
VLEDLVLPESDHTPTGLLQFARLPLVASDIARQLAGPEVHTAPRRHVVASELSTLVDAAQPALWVHGHIHEQRDYRLGPTRVVCNPRGTRDGHGFDPELVVEV